MKNHRFLQNGRFPRWNGAKSQISRPWCPVWPFSPFVPGGTVASADAGGHRPPSFKMQPNESGHRAHDQPTRPPFLLQGTPHHPHARNDRNQAPAPHTLLYIDNLQACPVPSGRVPLFCFVLSVYFGVVCPIILPYANNLRFF